MTRICRISFTAADSKRLGAFYQHAFGFEVIGIEQRGGEDFARLIGIAGAEAEALLLRLGDQSIELLAFAKPGLPYPKGSKSSDPLFQHIAILVSDMQAAYARLLQCEGWSPITRPAPQRLPPSSGGVTALKFRDPEGHPLELLSFPPENIPAYWQEAADRRGPCLGIDHSAIVVASTARSARFYRRVLGFSVGGRSLNQGREQDQLDGLHDAVVEVTMLNPSSPDPPHLELLCYRCEPVRRNATASLRSNDIAATRLVLEVGDFPSIEEKLTAAGVPFVSTEPITLCAVERRDHPVGDRPTRQLSLQPVAIGAVVEVTKRLKPSMERVT